MSFIDKIKNKLKSTSAKDLLASVPGIEKQAKDFTKDFQTMVTLAQTAMTEYSTRLAAMKNGGAVKFDDTRKDFELAAGQVGRVSKDFTTFVGSYATFIVDMMNVDEQLTSLGKKEKDAKVSKDLDAASKVIRKLIVDANRAMTKTPEKQLEDAAKAAKKEVSDAQKLFDAAISKVEQVVSQVVVQGKLADQVVKEIKKLAAEGMKACDKMDLKKGLAALKAINERQAKHAAIGGMLETHKKMMDTLGNSSSISGQGSSKGAVLSPAQAKAYDAVHFAHFADTKTIADLIKNLTKALRDLKNAAGIA